MNDVKTINGIEIHKLTDAERDDRSKIAEKLMMTYDKTLTALNVLEHGNGDVLLPFVLVELISDTTKYGAEFLCVSENLLGDLSPNQLSEVIAAFCALNYSDEGGEEHAR